MESEQQIQTSILDRLVDEEPQARREPVRQRMIGVNQVRNAVIRDVEELLNTRRQILVPPAACKNLNSSLFTYGLRDFTSQNPRSPSVKQQLRYELERTIARFEPRLKNVVVHLDNLPENERNLRFRITGLLVVDPISEPVTFDTYFDINRGEYLIAR